MKTAPTLAYELALAERYELRYVAGLDEAGRGALAGPVVAAAVILPPGAEPTLRGVNDSKQLTAVTRETLFDVIIANALAYGIGAATAQEIDAEGILPATRLAMTRALAQLNPSPDGLLIDGRIRLARVNLPQQAIVRGDSLSLSIAAASILAKVSRDREMIALDPFYPLYNFAQHKGYGTEAHRAAIAKYGATAVHRHTFAPIRTPLQFEESKGTKS